MSDHRPPATYRLDCSRSSTVAICGHCGQRFLAARSEAAARDLLRHQQGAHTDARISGGLYRAAAK